jgi:ATP-dependent helicase/nuclease subunit B
LYENSEKLSSATHARFYYKNITEVLSHPYIRILYSNTDDDKNPENIIRSILSANKIFFSQEDILHFTKEPGLIKIFSITKNKCSELPSLFISLINAICQALCTKKSSPVKIETEHLFYFAGIMNRIKTLLSECNFINDLKTIHTLFRNIASSTSLPFSGEPLKGLQVMGMLETRTLDFDNIILLSANENILPAGKHQNTFIPLDIRISAGLSTYKQKEAIFGYHFYRLLQRAQNIHLLYNSQIDKFGSGEKSRFITQLLEELPRYNKQCKISQQILINKIQFSEKSNAINISKTPEIVDVIRKIAEKGLSPTALNSYICCPLKFYFSYVEGLEESDEVAETIDAATLGTVIHYVLKQLFKDHIQKELNETDVKNMHSKSSALCSEAFRIHYPEGDTAFGKNLLISKVAVKLINDFLDEEIREISKLKTINQTLIIRSLEEPYGAELPAIMCEGEKITPRLKGHIDRIDQCGDMIRIIDYKTGKVEKGDLKIQLWDELLTKPDLSKCMQLLCYAYVYMHETKLSESSAGIISLRKLSEGYMPVQFSEFNTDCIDQEILQKFADTVTKLISEMLDKNLHFNQTSDDENCANCTFSAICNR